MIQSSANGVYAFGFLFMLPQLFINYKLKSVAHLPWRAFAYKAFNTFIGEKFWNFGANNRQSIDLFHETVFYFFAAGIGPTAYLSPQLKKK